MGEIVFVDAPTEGTRTVDAVFVPDRRYDSSNGVWLVEFENGVTREFRTAAGWRLTARDLCGLTQFGAEVAVKSADIRDEVEASMPPRPMVHRCQCEAHRRW